MNGQNHVAMSDTSITWLTELDAIKDANPQSETRTFSSSSRRMFPDLKFLWITGGSQTSCRYLNVNINIKKILLTALQRVHQSGYRILI